MRKWYIIEVKGVTNGAAVQDISWKTPAEVRRCTEIILSADTDAPDAQNNLLGRLSLWFNNKRTHALHYCIQEKNIADLKRKYVPLPLEQELKGNELFQGFYLDAGNAVSYPYDVKIYLHCNINA